MNLLTCYQLTIEQYKILLIFRNHRLIFFNDVDFVIYASISKQNLFLLHHIIPPVSNLLNGDGTEMNEDETMAFARKKVEKKRENGKNCKEKMEAS